MKFKNKNKNVNDFISIFIKNICKNEIKDFKCLIHILINIKIINNKKIRERCYSLK